MSQKNETPILILSLLITLGLIGGGFWWFSKNFRGFNQNQVNNPQPNSSATNFADVKNVPAGLFNYGGSTSWAPIRLAVDPIIQKQRPEYKLRYVQPPSGIDPDSATGIQSLIDGQLTFSQSSRPILDS